VSKNLSSIYHEGGDPNGTICIIDWKKEGKAGGPPVAGRCSIGEVIKTFEAAFFEDIAVSGNAESVPQASSRSG
jgi:hypothetical protein